jgi:diguanylate cyclase (GGDEF)-like protein/PAS domain S-box-containing protein
MATLISFPMARTLKHDAETPSPEWISRFVDDIPTGVAVFDRDLSYVAANPAWLDVFGLGPRPFEGRRHDELDPITGIEIAQLQRRALCGQVVDGGNTVERDAAGRLHHRAISVRPRIGNDGNILGVIAALQDVVTEASQGASDRLTGTAGRHRFLARLRAALATAKPRRDGIPVFLLDIDNFKGVNDLYGSRVGDRVLKTIADRLLEASRSRPIRAIASDDAASVEEGDMVARLGADEFGIVLGSPAPSLAYAEAFARRLLQLVATPVEIGEQRIRLTANIGFILTGPEHRNEDDLLRDLDVALQEAKARGPNGAKAWEPALTSSVGRRLALLDQLRRALDEHEFVLQYQPILSLQEGRVVGAEALLRWKHPTEGIIAPAHFLPALEESGLIVPVGCWVLREVVSQMQVWHMLYGRDMLDWVSVNVSARQFNDPSLLLSTLNEIHASGFPLDRIKLEITESAVMRNPELTRTVLGQLHNLGIRLALDDFGTGYSALGALRHYQVDTIKIDHDFTARLDTEDGKELVMALLRIARIYGADVVAEGVETTAQHTILRGSGCGYGQGYLFAKPMDGSFFGAYVLTHMVENSGTC